MALLATPISNNVKKIWDKWNLRSFIILSLTLQIFLVLFAPLRKRTSSRWVTVPIWLAYLLADWAANFAIGLIASSQTSTDEGSLENGHLLSFWAPFLLLHLGGPDTIIAIAMEDNALWPRHLLSLIFQVVAAVYVFGMQFSEQNKLLWPTLLLFVAGLVKYGERTRALYLASLEALKDTRYPVQEPALDYAKYMDEFSSRKVAGIPASLTIERGRSSESKNVTYQREEGGIDNIRLVKDAYFSSQISMGLIIDLVYNYSQRNESRAYFNQLTPGEAFTSIVAELNFMYEALYTKFYVIHSRWGYALRTTSFIAVCIALAFFFRLEKHGFHKFDVGLTYSLLFGAIALDSVALLMLILSDRTITIVYTFCKQFSAVNDLMKKYMEFKTSWRPTTTSKCLELTRKILFRRWCESISGFSFLNYSLRECGRPVDRSLNAYHRIIRFLGHLCLRVIIFLGLKHHLDELNYRSSNRLAQNLWDFVFLELKLKSTFLQEAKDNREIAKEICSSQGDWILKEKLKDEKLREDLQWQLFIYDRHHQELFDGVSYDRRVLMWHIATEMWYYKEINKYGNSDEGEGEGHSGEGEGEGEGDFHQRREFSKTLSDYMLYLLIMQPALMYTVAGIGQKRFGDTVAEAKKFFQTRGLGSDAKPYEAQGKLFDVHTSVKPADIRVDGSKSVLFEACILAESLERLGDWKWELISSVWVDLLSYAASHCRANSHAQLLTKGGELVTFVWLLMARFGIEEIIPVMEDIQVAQAAMSVKLIVAMEPDIFNEA